MGKPITVLELCERVLSSSGLPLDPPAIWEKAIELGLVNDLSGRPGDIYSSIVPSLEKDIATTSSVFYRHSPTKFGFHARQEPHLCFSHNEGALYPLLVRYLHTNHHFNAVAKTLDPSKAISMFGSSYGGKDVFPHPDVVGIRFPAPGQSDATPDANGKDLHYFSFEVCRQLTLANLHQSYYEAVANSSWANEGYLVVGGIDQADDAFHELSRLNAAFGIGIIKLNFDNADESEIVLNARTNATRHSGTFNRLLESHPDFSEMVDDAGRSLLSGKIQGGFDPIFSDEELMAFIKKNNIH